MSVLKSKDNKELIINCNCECDEGIRIKIQEFHDDDYSILTYSNGNFYRDQNHTVWNVISLKLKKIWKVIRNKDHCYSEIILSKKDFEELKEYINNIE